MTFAIEVAIAGLLVGIMYSLVALGFVLIYKSSGIFNFAQGDMTLLSALALVGALTFLPLWLAIPAVLAMMVGLAIAVERVVLRPLVARPPLTLFMATIGLGFLLEGIGQGIWGTDPKGLDIGISDIPFKIRGFMISQLDLLGALLSGGLVLGLVWFFQKSRTGRALRAGSDDREGALSVGSPLGKTWAVTWAISGLVALVAGVMWGTRLGVQFSLSLIALKALPVLILGGIDSIPGAIIAGLIVGSSENLAEVFIGPYVGGGIQTFFPYLLALLVLWFKPYGMFGREIIERV